MPDEELEIIPIKEELSSPSGIGSDEDSELETIEF